MMNLTDKVTSNNHLPDKSLLSGIGWCSCSSLSSGVKISIFFLQLGPQRAPEVVPVKRCRQLWSSSAIAHSFIRTAPLYYPICSYRVSTSTNLREHGYVTYWEIPGDRTGNTILITYDVSPGLKFIGMWVTPTLLKHVKCMVQCKPAVAPDSGEICVCIWTMVHSDMCGFWGIVGLHTREFSFPDKMVPWLLDTP